MFENIFKTLGKLLDKLPASTNQNHKVEEITPKVILEKLNNEKLLIDVNKFYTEWKKQFGSLTQQQTKGLNHILSCLKTYDKNFFTLEQLAYIFATVKWESDHTMMPIEEGLSYSAKRLMEYWPKWFKNLNFARLYERNPRKLANYIYGNTTNIGKELGNTNPDDGWKYRGQGHIQLTGRDVYTRVGKRLNIDLVNHPELMLQPDISWQVAVVAMCEGLMTGVKLSKYISANNVDFINARRVVNGTNRAVDIANIGHKFIVILKNSLINQ